MGKIVAKNLNGTKAAITLDAGIPAITPVEGNYTLLKQLDTVSRELDFGAVDALDPGNRGAGEYERLDNFIKPTKHEAVMIYVFTR